MTSLKSGIATLSAALLSLSIALPAAAQDGKAFHGFYFGAEGGLDRGKLENGNQKLVSETGVYGGGLVGWRYQFDNNIVIGAEYDLGYSSVKDRNLATIDGIPVLVGLKHGWHDNIVGNIGYAFGDGDRSMIFGTIGTALTSSGNDDAVVVLGGGFEQTLSRRMNFRIRATFLSDADFIGIKQDQVKVLAGLIFRF